MITVQVLLYGPLARFGPSEDDGVCDQQKVETADGTVIGELLAALGVPTEERGVTFINGHLSAMPGVQPDLGHRLADGDRVAFFHLKSMWPCQYRHGAAVTPELESTLTTPSHSPGTSGLVLREGDCPDE